MTDIGSIIGELAGRAARRAPRRGHVEVPTINTGADGVVYGPGAVTEGLPLDAPAEQRLDRLGTMVAIWGEEAGVMARRSRYRPRWPQALQTRAPDFPIGPGGVVDQFSLPHRAARATGVPEAFLNTLIVQESGGRTDARAETSSATGSTQFIDDTWLGMIHRYGARYGHPDLADAVKKRENGRGYHVADARLRRDILELRYSPEWSAIMGAEHARENAVTLRSRIGRDPRHGEVYFAHFVGVDAASNMIRAADEDGRRERGRARRAVEFVSPEAAEANRSIFYEGARARSVSEVVAIQSRKFSRDAFRLSAPEY